MRDPFPIPPIPALSAAVQPFADATGMASLPHHIHEVLLAAIFYTFIQVVFSPWMSMRYFPSYYPRSRGKKANWDSHVVSMVQSVLINILALWCMWADEERKNMDWEQRIWGYTGACGLVQALITGYFVWDLVMTTVYIDVFGFGLFVHASSALVVYSLGFRPFVNYYGCIFILYELSTPFLNLHWFFDKLQMTGSKAQLINGIVLLATFFSCRLIYGVAQSGLLYVDMYHALRSGGPPLPLADKTLVNNASIVYGGDKDIMVFAQDAGPIPIWLVLVYTTSNITLTCLNITWFYKMIKAVRKRFDPPKTKAAETEKKKEDGEAAATGAHIGLDTLDEVRKRIIPEIVPQIESDLAEMQ